MAPLYALSQHGLASVALASSNDNAGELKFDAPSGYSFKTYNASAVPTSTAINRDFSDQALAFLWDQVGPVATGPVTATVSPTPEPSVYHTPGDVVAEHYYLYKQDFARLKSLGVPALSPSISWPRIFPFGKGPVNEAGVKHYDNVIAELVKSGIAPAVTLFHWDTPLALFNEYGAWTDRHIVDGFFNYARFIISRYDQYVDTWFTINEPQYCNWQYSYYPAGEYYLAYNGVTGGLKARFLCGHYTLLAHAKVAKWYHEEFKDKGRITFKNSGNYYEANSTSEADEVARQRNYDFAVGWFGGPWTNGDYPTSLRYVGRLATKALFKGEWR
jgi:beta-glucosidase/6-phospho-beta-glucosidase/beta-galactosidase